MKMNKKYYDEIMNSLPEDERTIMSSNLGSDKSKNNNEMNAIVYEDFILKYNKPIAYIHLTDSGKLGLAKGDLNISFAVIPSERKNGYASKLISKAIKWFRKSKYDTISWIANKNNKGSISLAKKFGFKRYKKYENGTDEFYMICNPSYIEEEYVKLNESNSKSIIKTNCRWDEIYAIYNTLAPHERLFLGSRFINSPNTVFRWIIQCNGENAGYMELYDMKKSGSHKKELVVSTAICPQYRGIGILEELEKEAENFVYNSSKYNKLIWYAKDDNKRSFKCAERLGYTKRFHELDHWVFDKTIEHKKLLDESNDGKVPFIMSEKDMYCNMSKFHKYGKVFVTGLSGAGKTTIVKDLSKKYDATVVNLDICHCKLLSICYKPNRSIEELKDNKFGYEFAKSKFGKRVIDMTKKYTKEQCWEPKYVAEIVKNVLDYIDTLNGNFVIEGCQLVYIDLIDKKYIDYPWVFKGTSALKAVCRRTFRDGVKYIPVTIQYIDQWIDQQNHIRELVISNSNEIEYKEEIKL